MSSNIHNAFRFAYLAGYGERIDSEKWNFSVDTIGQDMFDKMFAQGEKQKNIENESTID